MRFISLLLLTSISCFGAITGNEFYDFEDSTAGTALTTTILDNGTKGDIGTWAIIGPGTLEVTAEANAALSTYRIGSSVYSTADGTRGFRVSMFRHSTYARRNFDSSSSEVYVGGYATFSADPSNDWLDQILIEQSSGGFFVLQSRATQMIAHTSGTQGSLVSMTPGTRYFFEMHAIQNSTCTIRLYNATTGAFLVQSQGTIGNSAFVRVRFGRNDTHGSDSNAAYADEWTEYDNVVIRTGSGLSFPRGPISEYFVNSTGGNNANPGTSGSPWATVDYAADNVQPGDLVTVVGTHTAAVTPARSGTATEPITFYGAGSGITGIWTMSAVPYIRLVDLIIDANGATEAIYIPNADGIEVWNCTIRETTRSAISMANSAETFESDNCIFFGNTFQGNTEARFFALRGNNNLIAYNIFSNPNDDCVYQLFGNFNRIMNNYQSRPATGTGNHTDFIQHVRGPNDFGLVEANLYIDSLTGEDHHHFSNLESLDDLTISDNLVFRYNATWGVGTYQHSIGDSGDVHGVRIYNDSYVEGQRFSASAGTGIINTSDDANIYNTIAYEIWGATAVNPAVWSLSGAGELHDYNLFYDPDGSQTFSGDASAANEPNSVRNQDPLFANLSTYDFQLQSGSPARGVGRHLTTVSSASSSGTVFNVVDAEFFRGDDTTLSQYGGALIQGDTITVGTDVLTIVSISGNAITVTPSFTWANGDFVWFGNDTTPDMGAYPYSASTHTPAGTIDDDGADSGASGEVFTVTGTGSIRFVVFYENGLPVSIDFTPPYTHPRITPSATITADLAALYASSTPLVAAGAPAAPTDPGVVASGVIFNGVTQ